MIDDTTALGRLRFKHKTVVRIVDFGCSREILGEMLASSELDHPAASGKPQTNPYLTTDVGWPKETGDMHLWAHHLGCETVDDVALQVAGTRQQVGSWWLVAGS